MFRSEVLQAAVDEKMLNNRALKKYLLRIQDELKVNKVTVEMTDGGSLQRCGEGIDRRDVR